MHYKNEYPPDEKELKKHLPKVLKSGLFSLGEDGKPNGLLRLVGKTKTLSQRKSTVSNIPDLNLKIVAWKLNRIIFSYKQDIPHSIYLTFNSDINEDFDDFKAGLIKHMENHDLLPELQPQIDSLLKKAHRVYKKKYQNDWYPDRKELTKKKKWFSNLVSPLYSIFKKYLTDQEKKRLVNDTNIFHYIAHLLIACDIETKDPARGHMPIFEKIKRYNLRHSKYLK